MALGKSRFREYLSQALSLNRDLKLIFAAHMLWNFGEGLYSFILPLYVLQLGGDPAAIGLVTSVMYVVVTFSTLVGGFLADRFDRKKLILQIWIFATPAKLIYSFATEWWHLIPGIVIYSLIFGGPAEDAYIAASVPEEKMARAFTITEIGYSLGMIFSPLFGAYLLAFLDMRWLFRMSFVVSLISMFPLFLISSQFPQRKEKASRPLGDFVSSLKNRSFRIWMPVFIVVAFTTTMISPFLSPALKDVYKLDSSTILALGSVVSVGEVALGVFFGWFGDHATCPRALSLSVAVVSAGAFLLAFPSLFFIVLIAIFLMGARRSVIALPRSIVGKFSPNIPAGAMFAIYWVIVGITQALAPEVGSRLYEFSPTQLLFFSAILGLVIVPFIFLAEKKLKS